MGIMKAIRRLFGAGELEKLGQEYQYRPLADDEIRLVRVNPGTRKKGIVTCEIFHTQLQDAPKYEAISYTWGDANELCAIICGPQGEMLTVTANCGSILERLHYRRKKTIAWIDAICINQQDMIERNAQVAMMGKIYAQAEQALIDLGAVSEDSDLAIEEIEAGPKPRSAMPERTAAAVRSLLSRPWFTRIWVIQEVYNAQFAQVVCGLNGFDWLELSVWTVVRQEDIDESSQPAVPYSIAMGAEKRIRSYNAASDLLSMLYRTQPCHSTDPRDKYFALLGMISDAADEGLVADYRKSTQMVFTELAEYLLLKNGTNLLSCVQAGSNIAGLPSWAPDWSLPPASMAFREVKLGEENVPPWNGHCAGGDVDLAHWELLQQPSRAAILKARGYLVDTVSKVMETFDTQDCKLEDIREAYERSRAVIEKLPPLASPWPSDDNKLILWRTLTRSEVLPAHIIAEDMRTMWDREPDEEGYLHNRQAVTSLRHKVRLHLHNQALCLTEHNFLGLLPVGTVASDAVVVIFGCPMPLVLRPHGDTWKLLGHCYVDALMMGIYTAKLCRNRDELHGESPPEGCQDFLIR